MRAVLTPSHSPRSARHRRRSALQATSVLASGLVVAVAACGDGSDARDAGRPHLVVTTSILGDVVTNLVGDRASVEVLIPPGADPHEASLSARQADEMVQADLVVVNGAGFEQGMSSVLDAVESDGAELFTMADHVELASFADHHAAEEGHEDDHAGSAEDDHAAEGHEDDHAGSAEDDHAAEGHEDDHAGSAEDDHAAEEGHEDDHAGDAHGHDHDRDDLDPHFWTDPTRMVAATEALADRLAGVEGLDAATVERNAASYVEELEALDTEMSGTLAAVPEDRRVLVTNHEVFGYFAQRYGFEVVGTVIPAGTTQAEPSSSEVEALAGTIAESEVPAIFVETSSPATLAEGLADSVGDVELVELFSESLGEEGSGGDTYLGMMRTNAERIAEALA